MTMGKVMRYLTVLIVAGFFILATFLLFSSYFDYLSQEVRVVFAAFLYLYGVFRLVRTFLKRPGRDEENDD
ncbi:MAG: hypothetical protein JXA23_12455 [Bacteroidales bacterium]|nr:hypothetical protein [Bacteroidales bacterium]